MLIRIGYDIYSISPAPTPMNLLLYVHPSRAASLRKPEAVIIERWIPVQYYTDEFDNRVGRIVVQQFIVRTDELKTI